MPFDCGVQGDQSGYGIFKQTIDIRDSIAQCCIIHGLCLCTAHQVRPLSRLFLRYSIIWTGANGILSLRWGAVCSHPWRISNLMTFFTARCAHKTIRIGYYGCFSGSSEWNGQGLFLFSIKKYGRTTRMNSEGFGMNFFAWSVYDLGPKSYMRRDDRWL